MNNNTISKNLLHYKCTKIFEADIIGLDYLSDWQAIWVGIAWILAIFSSCNLQVGKMFLSEICLSRRKLKFRLQGSNNINYSMCWVESSCAIFLFKLV